MKIHIVGAQESNAPWAFELRVIRELEKLGHEVISTDFRKKRHYLQRILSETRADFTLVFKGEWISRRVIRTASSPTSLWFAEYLGNTPFSEIDYLTLRNRAIFRYNCTGFEHVFIHDPSNLPICRKLGAQNISWLSCVAVDTAVFGKTGASKDYDVVFIGSPTPRRVQLLKNLSKHYSIFWPSVWEPDQMNLVFNRARIVLNIHSSSVLNIETRIGEVLGAGAFLLSEEISSPGMFQARQHLDYWPQGDVTTLIQKIGYYLGHDEEREAIAEAGYNFARQNHSLEVRTSQLLDLLQGKTADLPDENEKSSVYPRASLSDYLRYLFLKSKADIWGMRERAHLKRIGAH